MGFIESDQVYVYELGHEMRCYAATIKTDRVEAKRGKRTWLNPYEVRPRRLNRPQNWDRRVLLACGPQIIPWPEAYVVRDTGDEEDGDDPVITPEYLDALVKTVDTEAMLRGVKGMTMSDRLLHMAAGAAAILVVLLFIGPTIGVQFNPTGLVQLPTGAPANDTSVAQPVTEAALALVAAPARLLNRLMRRADDQEA